MWQLFTPLAGVTGVLWLAALRRPRAGYCRVCGYNLTGNVSGICPECGQRVVPEAPRDDVPKP